MIINNGLMRITMIYCISFISLFKTFLTSSDIVVDYVKKLDKFSKKI